MSRIIGINRAGSIWITAEEMQRIALNGLHNRVDFRYEFGDGARDNYDRIARGHGVTYLPILIWDKPRPQTSLDWFYWLSYVRTVVMRYPHQRRWQIWNEPNNARNPQTLFPGPEEWRAFTRRTAAAIREANPMASAMAGGIAVGGHGSVKIRDYHEEWFLNTGTERIAIHTYCGNADEAAQAINNTRKLVDKPVWCTELGRKSTVDGEIGQRRWYRRVRALTGGVPLFWFCLQDVDGAYDGLGAIKRDNWPKPVWYALGE